MMSEDDVDENQKMIGDGTSNDEVRKVCNFKFDELCTKKDFDQPSLYRRMKAKEFNMDYYHKTGLNEVLLFDCPTTELGMKMVDDSFNEDDVLRLVGEKRKLLCVNVDTQESEEMTLGRFVEYYKKKDKSVLYNVLSLEFSHSGLTDLVEPPSLIREIDWVSSWPDERKKRTIIFDKSGNFDVSFSYPRVENYCLMSPNESFTDFHIDFHGTSVWYHVKKGKKVFWIIEPTEKNLKMYEKYTTSEDHSGFFGDLVEKCARVVVLPGHTLIMPSGWIHSVYTPEDSLVFGGNFLHSRQIGMQLSVLEGENRMKINKKFMFPYSEETVFFYLSNIIRKVTGREYIRPASRNEHNLLNEYVGELFMEKRMNKRIPNEKDYENDGCAWETKWDETKEYLNSVKILAKWDGDVEEKKNEDEVELDGLMQESDAEDGKMKYILSAKKELKWGDPTNFFLTDHIFYHPLSFNLDGGSETPIHSLPHSRNEPPLQINRDELKSGIDGQAIPQLEALIIHFLGKKAIDLPEGMTRPFSLLLCFMRLLRERRVIAEKEEKMSLPPCILPDDKKSMEIHEVQKKEEKKRVAERKRKRELKKAKEDGDDEDDYKPKTKKSKKNGEEEGKREMITRHMARSAKGEITRK